MRQEKIQYFTEKEEEFVDLLIEIGMKKIVAKVLVFFAGTPEATSRDIERGADMRQPEVGTALNYMMEQGWITESSIPSENKVGRKNVKPARRSAPAPARSSGANTSPRSPP